MRYLGNKAKLIDFIDKVISKYNIKGETFGDIFSGTAVVGDHFKGKYSVISNDYMYFSSVISSAKLFNNGIPLFAKFKKLYGMTPFEWLNGSNYDSQKIGFIYNEYSPAGNRMYFTEENAQRIDGMRMKIENLYRDKTFSEAEYYFVLASLLESVTKVSNTSGTYQAFFKFWEHRALKKLVIQPLELEKSELHGNNNVFCEDTNKLVRQIEGDIAYIDPPYTTTQYANSYHLLETIARYDDPEIFGKTGRRKNRRLSNYSNKKRAAIEFEDLFRQLRFKHVLISYSNQSILSLEELVTLAKKFAVDNKVYVETNEYREYVTNNKSYKGNGDSLKEIIIYFEKDLNINKSPLNYSGSKDVVMDKIIRYLPKHVGTFVDAMGGAFNVGANVVAMDKVYYVEYNKYIFDIMDMLLNKESGQLLNEIKKIIDKFGLERKGKEAYLNLRTYYNSHKNPLLLFVLQIYSFQNMIRFNSKMNLNTPVGNNEFSENIKRRIIDFKVKTKNFNLKNDLYQNINLNTIPIDTVFYFDPPYLITKAEYNDGKRGLQGWDSEKETELLKFLDNLNEMGYKFMLSNVTQHKGKIHHILINWAHEHKYNIIQIGKTGIKYPRKEVVVTNYNE